MPTILLALLCFKLWFHITFNAPKSVEDPYGLLVWFWMHLDACGWLTQPTKKIFSVAYFPWTNLISASAWKKKLKNNPSAPSANIIDFSVISLFVNKSTTNWFVMPEYYITSNFQRQQVSFGGLVILDASGGCLGKPDLKNCLKFVSAYENQWSLKILLIKESFIQISYEVKTHTAFVLETQN